MYREKTTSYAHQTVARDKARGREGFGFLMEMGTGKTKVAIDEMGEDWLNRDVEQALILAPNGVYSNWALREIPTHMPDELIKQSHIHLWDGGGTVRERNAINDLYNETDKFGILNMNLEAIGASDKAWGLANEFVKKRPTTILVDESTMIKNHDAIVTKSLARFRSNAAKARILTGYPNPHSPLDLFSQMDFAVPGSMGANFYSFRHKYALTKKIKIGVKKLRSDKLVDNLATIVTGFQNQGELAQRLERHSYRALKKDCLDLPPENYILRKVEMTNDQWRIYKNMREDCTSELEKAGDYVTATMVITQMLRLHQIVCGFVKTDDGREVGIKNNRVKALMQHVEEWCGRPGIIWCTYQFNIAEVVAALKHYLGPTRAHKVVEYHGGISRAQCDQNITRFQTDGTADYFVATEQKGGFGITLTRGADDCFFSNTWRLEHRLQAEARNHRSGQKNSVNHGDLMCEGTVDEEMLKALRKRIDLNDAVLRDGFRKWVM